MPVCHEGLVNSVLTPPPPAAMPLALVSFQAVSGMYDKAVALVSVGLLDPFQYCVSGAMPLEHELPGHAPGSPVNSLPPSPVT